VSKATGKAKKGARSAASEGPVKVLLAEDEESFVEALVIGLTNEGFRVTVARDGLEALTLFDETGPDILLLDLMLPKMSGIDVCRTIRARSQVPIIMVTAKGTEIDTVVALEVGADDYVTKRVCGRCCGGRRAGRRRPTPERSTSPTTAAGSPMGSKWTSTNGVCSYAARRYTCAARSSSCYASWSRTPAGS